MARRWVFFGMVWLAPATAGAERLPIERFTTADGLGDNAVNRIVRDSRGYLWFCTREGLSRFDGHTFVTYGVEHGLPSAVVYDFLETREGELWVATRGGLVRFDPLGEPTAAAHPGRRAMFTAYHTGQQSPASAVGALLEDRSGVIWVATFSGLFRLETTAGRPHLARVDLNIPRNLDSRVYALLEDAAGALWIGTASGLYRRPAEGAVERHWPDAGSAGTVHSLLQDRRGDLWAGTRTGGLLRIRMESRTGGVLATHAYTAGDGLPSHWINGLFETSDGGLWAGSNSGLVQLVRRGNGTDYRFRTYSVAQGLPNHEITTIAEDRAGSLWIGALAGGVARIATTGFTIFDAADGVAWADALLGTRDGELLAVGSRTLNELSLFRYVDERLVETPIPAMRERRAWGWNQTVLVDRTGDWWLATTGGVLRLSGIAALDDLSRAAPRRLYTMRDGLPNDVVLRLFEDARGDVWISTTGHGDRPNGLTRWQRATGTLASFTESDGLPSLDSYFVSAFAEDRAGNVWIGFSGDGGLVRSRHGSFTRFGSAHGVPLGPVRNLLVDSRGRLWIANIHGGLVRCDDPDADAPRFVVYTTAQGLSSNGVHAVVEDLRGVIWVATARGIDRLDPTSGSVRRVRSVVGLEGGEVAAAFADRHGAVWFSRGTSMVRLVPRDLPEMAPPRTLITGARIAGRELPISALGQPVIEPVKLPARDNQVELEFVAPGSGPGATLYYQMWLEGADAAWGDPSGYRSIRFASLSPGVYRFHVRAMNADGLTGEAASFAFTILPPVWQRGWVLMLAALTVTWAAAALYRYRVGRLLEVANLRTRIATDLHDDIGANLTRIAVLSEVARQRGRAGEDVDPGLLSIADVARESVASLGEIVWAINPERDRLQDLKRRMREYAEDLLARDNIELRFEDPDPAGERRIPLGVRRDLFLVFKEAIRNAARHSGCQRIDVELRASGSALRLEIRDDGSGFDPAAATDGNGLRSMRRRADHLHARLAVITTPGEGTCVRLDVPLGHRPEHRRPPGPHPQE